MSGLETEPPERAAVEDPPGAVGESHNSKEGRRFVTGRGQYVDDIDRPGMLHGVFLRSPHAHAGIESIDTAAAEAMDGVRLVWTAADIEPHVEPFGHGSLGFADETVLADDRVRYQGEEVAVVLATDRETAVRATEAIEVSYDRLPALTDPESALEPDAPVIHPALDADPDCEVEGNLLHAFTVTAGDVEAAFEAADVVVEGRYGTNKTSPAALEPHGTVASYDPGEPHLTVWSSNQGPHLLVEKLAGAITALEPDDITCKLPDIGGSFGSKSELFSHEVCAAVLSMETGRPVKMVLDRLEEFQAGRTRSPEYFDARLALTDDGRMLGFDVELVQDTGAYGSFGKAIARSSSVVGAGPYRIPDQRVRGRVVYTNLTPSTAYRGFGDPQFTFARERLVDRAAAELGLDPIELRLRNVAGPDELPLRTATGLEWRAGDMPGCLRGVRELIDWEPRRGSGPDADGRLRGVGVASLMRRCGNKEAKGADYENAVVSMNHRGRATVYSGITSVGQGTETALAQIVADRLGLSVDRVTPVVGDSDVTPEGLGVFADRGSVIGGTAAAKAADDLRETLVRFGAHLLGADPDDVALGGNRLYLADAPSRDIAIEDLADLAVYGDPADRPPEFREGVTLVGRGTFESHESEFLDPETTTGNLSHTYTFGALAVAVAVDTGTGEVEVTDVAICEDAGTILNPKLAAGQIHGGIGQAIGETLLERYVYDDNGSLQNGTMIGYHLPTAADVPAEVAIRELETPDPSTSHGHKGIGESSIVPVPAAIANAVVDATGIDFDRYPLTPDVVLTALVEHGLD